MNVRITADTYCLGNDRANAGTGDITEGARNTGKHPRNGQGGYGQDDHVVVPIGMAPSGYLRIENSFIGYFPFILNM